MKKILLLLFMFVMMAGCKKADLFHDAASAPVTTRQTSTVTFTPNGGSFNPSQTVAISADNLVTAIYYRININGGWSLWSAYSSSFNVSNSCIVEAYAVNVKGNGAISQAVFSKTGEKPTVSFSPIGGAFTTSVSVTISATNSPSSTEYRINGGGWTAYTAPIALSSTSTLEARATNADGTGTAGPATYLIESFNPGEQNPVDFTGGFTVKAGTATITDMLDGTYQIATAATASIIYNPTDGKSNYIVSGEVRVNPVASYGIMFRMQDNALIQGYGFQYENGRLRLVYFNQGNNLNDASIMLNIPDTVPTPNIYNDPAGIQVANTWDNNWHTFAIVVNGNVIKVYLDGILKYNTDTGTSVFFTTSWWNGAHTTEYGIPPRWNAGGLGFRFWGAATVYARNWQYQDIH